MQPSAQRYVVCQLLYLNLQQLGANTELTRELVDQIGQAFQEPEGGPDEPEPEFEPQQAPEPEPEQPPTRPRIVAPHLQVLERPDEEEEQDESPNAG